MTLPLRSESFEAHMDRWTRKRTADRILGEWEDARWDAVQFLSILIYGAERNETSRGSNVVALVREAPTPPDFILEAFDRQLKCNAARVRSESKSRATKRAETKEETSMSSEYADELQNQDQRSLIDADGRCKWTACRHSSEEHDANGICTECPCIDYEPEEPPNVDE